MARSSLHLLFLTWKFCQKHKKSLLETQQKMIYGNMTYLKRTVCSFTKPSFYREPSCHFHVKMCVLLRYSVTNNFKQCIIVGLNSSPTYDRLKTQKLPGKFKTLPVLSLPWKLTLWTTLVFYKKYSSNSALLKNWKTRNYVETCTKPVRWII